MNFIFAAFVDPISNLTVGDWTANVWHLIVRLVVAALCGFCIGYERKTRSKEAGIRTHTIVCIAAALMMIISKYAFGDLGENRFDGSRVASQVVTGIGFLGAGMIFYKRDILQGLTTAAGIWATAGIGMALGAGLYVVAIVATALVLGIQIIMHLPIKFIKGRVYACLKAQIVIENEQTLDTLKALFGIKKFLKFRAISVDDKVFADVEFITHRLYKSKELYNLTKEYAFIKSLEVNEEV